MRPAIPASNSLAFWAATHGPPRPCFCGAARILARSHCRIAAVFLATAIRRPAIFLVRVGAAWRGAVVPGHTARRFSRTCYPRPIARGLRIVDLSGAWRLKQEQNRAVYGFKDANAQTAAELTERAVYGLPELKPNADQIPIGRPGCESRLLCDFRHSCAGALAFGRNCGLRSRHHLRFEVRRIRSRQGTHGAHPLRFSGRQFFRLLGLRTPSHRRDPRAIGAQFQPVDLHSSSLANPARDSVHDLCAT